MDELDQRLITILRHNARRSISEIADELKVSRATVRSRMEKLEQRGDIVGYTVVLRSDVVSMPVRGITLIEVEGRMSDQVVEALSGVESLTELDSVLREIRMIPGIISSETNLLLATPRSTGARL